MSFPGGAGAPGRPDPNDPNVKKLNALMESCFAKTAMSGVMGFGLGAVFGMFMASMAYDTPYTAMPPPPPPAPATPAGAAVGATPTTAATKIPTPTAIKTPLPTGTAAAAQSAATVSAVTASSTSAAAAATPSAAVLKPPNAPVTAVGAAASAAADSMVPISSLPLRRQLAIGFKDMGSRSYSTAKNFGMVGALFSGIECGIEGLRAKNDAANGVGAGCITGAILARNGGPQAAAFGCVGFAAFSAAIEAYLRQPKEE